jgi:hypothetical protein
MKLRAVGLLVVSTTLGGGAFSLQACSGDTTSIGGEPGTDSGADQTTNPPVDGSSADGNTAADTSTAPDTSPPPVGCAFTTDGGNAFECDDSTMCPGASPVCCLQGNVQADPVCGTLFGSKVKGTACRTACGTGEVQLCAKDNECTTSAAGKTCTPVATKGHSFGVCGAGLPALDGGLDGGPDCGKPPTLHPTNGNVGPFCPFVPDAGNRCPVGQTCCHPNNTDPEYCR